MKNDRVKKKVPVILQLGENESGPIALKMVLSYYHCYPEKDLLNQECGVSDNSRIPMERLKKVAFGHGFNAEVNTCTASELKTLDMPVITGIRGGNYCVLTGRKKGFYHGRCYACGGEEISKRQRVNDCSVWRSQR